MSSNDRSLIEVQFPVSKVSKESFKERKANLGQTLTGLGKWWGRKPLIMVRAAILGLLMPAGEDPRKDREIFLKILTMDDAGHRHRKNKSISPKEIYKSLTVSEKNRYLTEKGSKIAYKKGISWNVKQELQKTVFNRFSYDERLRYCLRPEEADNLPEKDWQVINDHLGTDASNLQELVQELGERKFGQVPVVGDCFCGGGSIPFEAARMGCHVYASELNPVAMLLTWAALNINGATDEKIKELRGFQRKIFNLADQQITAWGIEHNEEGDRANSYLYCHETVCPECGYRVPLAPSWIIGKGTKTIALLKENGDKGFDIEIISGASKDQILQAEQLATIKGNNMVCPVCPTDRKKHSIISIRKDRKKEDGEIEYGLRKWSKSEFVPLPVDVFQERLYCIRYEREYVDENGRAKTERYYRAPTGKDLEREEKVVSLLGEHFDEWQGKGYVPNSIVEEGDETTRLMRERGWAYWHQLFNPRQLLINGLLMKLVDQYAEAREEKAIGLLGINKCSNWSSKLSGWLSAKGNEKTAQTFYNQALNTFYNYGCRGFVSLETCWFYTINNYEIGSYTNLKLRDARAIDNCCQVWITDPPYSDAVNYHELSEFFLAWDKKMLLDTFPDWYIDSKRALAVKGAGVDFNRSMVEIYKSLTDHMPKKGMQVVMFTHQDVSVWADLTLILWAAGLRVTAAWSIATETDSGGLKDGNYVKGTVLLILRKQTLNDTPYLDEIYPKVEQEVKSQIDSMRELDDKEDPNFSDADYLLAAYAASLKTLTSYRRIEDIDVEYELSKVRIPGEESPIEKIINTAVKIAYDYLIPEGFDQFIWKMLSPDERFYIRGLELEKNGASEIGAYQELARGFGVKEYRFMLANTRANQARLKTALEFGMSGLNDSDGFNSTLLSSVFAALHQAIKTEKALNGRNWLKNEIPGYWNRRNTIIEIMDYIALFRHMEHMSHWDEEAKYARLIRELVKGDGV